MRQEMAEGRGEIVRQHLIPSTLGDGFLMHDSEGNLAPGAGRAMPQPWVMHDGQRHRLDDSLAPGFLLIGRPGWSPGEDVWRQADELKICLAPLGDAGPGIQSIDEDGPMIARWTRTLGQFGIVSWRERVFQLCVFPVLAGLFK